MSFCWESDDEMHPNISQPRSLVSIGFTIIVWLLLCLFLFSGNDLPRLMRDEGGWVLVIGLAVFAAASLEQNVRFWAQKDQSHFVFSAIALIVCVVLLLYNFDWSGFDNQFVPPFVQPRKELWDWLQLLAVLAVPIAVAIIGAQLQAQLQKAQNAEIEERRKSEQRRSAREKKRQQEQDEEEQKRRDDNVREQYYQDFIDRIWSLIQDDFQHNRKLRQIARTHTLTAFRRLQSDIRYIRLLLEFLHGNSLTTSNRQLQRLSESEYQWSNPVIMLKDVAVPNVDLRGANLDGIWLDSAKMPKARLDNKTYLREAYLVGIDFSDAELDGAKLDGANLGGANLTGAKLRETVLSNCDLRGAEIDVESLRHCQVTGAKLSGNNSKREWPGIDLSGVTLKDVELIGANLAGAVLRGSFLINATLTDAILEGADLTGTHLEGANLKGATIDPDQLAQAVCDETTTLPDGTKWQPPPPAKSVLPTIEVLSDFLDDD